MAEIRNISALETYPVRHPVLRGGKPIASCHFEGDDLETTKHFGYFDGANLLGVVSLFTSGNAKFSATDQFQIRGMAILEKYQKNGIGAALVRFTEDYLRAKNDGFIWFNAREKAVGFYEKLGYSIVGNAFEIPDVGLHYVMFKVLKPI